MKHLAGTRAGLAPRTAAGERGGVLARAGTMAVAPRDTARPRGLVLRRPATFSLSYGLLMLFIVLLYSNVAVLVPSLEIARPAQTVGAAALLALVMERSLARKGFCLLWPESHLMLAFLGAAALSCFTALWPRLAVESTQDLAKMTVIYLLIVNSIDSERRLRGLLWTMVIGGLFPALGALHYFGQGWLVEGERTAWIGIFANPNELAYSLVILIPLAAALGTGGPHHRIVSWVIIAIYLAAIGVTYSRGGILGLLAVLAVMVLRQRRSSLRFLAVALLAASVVFVTYFWSRQDSFSNLAGDTTFQQRVTTIKAGLAMFGDHPVLGVGLGCSVVAWPLYAPSEFYWSAWLHNHNTFTQALSETGFLGTIPFLLLVLAALASARSARKESSLWAFTAGLEAALWGFLVCALSGGYLLSWFPYMLFGLLSGAKRIARSEA